MGKGDKKSRKGKIAMGSYGKTRPRKIKPAAKPAAETEKK
jgi:30S ribosomal protein S31